MFRPPSTLSGVWWVICRPSSLPTAHYSLWHLISPSYSSVSLPSPLIWFCISSERPSYFSSPLPPASPSLNRFSFMSYLSSCLSQCTTFPSYVTSLSPVICICSSFLPQRPLSFLSYHLLQPCFLHRSRTCLWRGQQPLLSTQAPL